MSYWIYDVGHGGIDPGAIGQNGLHEADINLKLALKAREILVAHGEKVDMTRYGDTTVDLSARPAFANSHGCDYFVSFHNNSSDNRSVSGTEVHVQGLGGKAQILGNSILNELAQVISPNRGLKVSNLCVNRESNMPSCLIEADFISNPTIEAQMRTEEWINKVSIAIAKGCLKMVGKSYNRTQPTPIVKHPIMGKADLTKEQIVKYILSNNPNPQIPVPIDEFVSYYFEEGEIENIRADYSICQSILESGFFKFGNDVKPEQCNYSGIGSTANGVNGASFPDARTGIRAQIQHLKAYASSEPLKQTCVDPRYNLITTKGFAPNVEDLSSKWSVQSDYGQKIIAIYEKIKSIKVDSTPIPTIRYQAQVENIGWQGWVKNGETAGTEAKGLRLEALAIDYQGSGSISVEGYIQNIGWQTIRHSGEIVGTVGKALRLEAIKITLDDKNYSVQYQVHVQNIGWMPWVSYGEIAGTVGQNKRIEAIRIKIANK